MQEGCDLLSDVQEGLIPEDQQKKIFAQRKQELLAYAAYVRAQRRLWSLLTDSDPRLVRIPDALPVERTSREQRGRKGGDS